MHDFGLGFGHKSAFGKSVPTANPISLEYMYKYFQIILYDAILEIEYFERYFKI